MPQVRLKPQDDGGVTVDDGLHPPVYLPQLRIRTWVKIGTDFQYRQAVLDTGAPASIFSKAVWSKLAEAGQIEWVCHPPDNPDLDHLPRMTVLHGRFPYRLGRTTLQLVELGAGELRPVSVLIQCTEDERRRPDDPEPLPRLLLLGLQGVMNGRTLTLSVSTDGVMWVGELRE